jgi:hypothetical protein
LLKGFLPPKVTVQAVKFEYDRILGMLNDTYLPDTSALAITYFAQQKTMTGTYSLPEWGGGGAIGTREIVVALDAPHFLYKDFMQVTVHELVHIIIQRICREKIPRWFHEGVAMTIAGEVSPEEQLVLSQAILTGRLVNLSSIDSVNSFGRSRALLCYAQSHQAVLWLVDNYGMEVIREILAGTSFDQNFEKGLKRTLEFDMNEIESAYRAYLVKKFRFAFFLADTYILWIGILLLFIAGYAAVMLRKYRRLSQMEKDELTEQSTPDIPEEQPRD